MYKNIPRASNCSEIWKANSLVGVNINPKYRWGFCSNACKIGKANAPVLPDPVSARPITSFPFNVTGIASLCIFVGLVHFNC